MLCVRVHDGAGRHGVAVGVPVTASDAWPSLWPVLVVVTSTWYCAWTRPAPRVSAYRLPLVVAPDNRVVAAGYQAPAA